MSISSPFIRRPVATSLLAAAFLVIGIVAFLSLPVAALPQVDFPTIQVQANLPGASPETMASNVATPLERQFSLIAGITQMTSSSSSGATTVILQFDLNRNIDAAAQDVQAAINAAGGQLPTNLPSPPTIRKVNPADTSILTLSLTSDTAPIALVSDYADNILSQQISRIDGVGQVMINGQQKPAMRIQIDPRKVANLGLQLDTIRSSIANTTVNAPKGLINGATRSYSIYANDQVLDAATWNKTVIAYKNGAPVRIQDIGTAIADVENNQIGGWLFAGGANKDESLTNGRAILLQVFKQPGANVIQTVDRIRAALPGLQANIPPSIVVHLLADRTQTIRASVQDVEVTLLITIVLVVGVIFLFLRNLRATIIPSLVIPLALLATAAVMLPLGFSLDNLSLMALTIAVGFVVDDAIVMVEVIWRRIEEGEAPFEAALAGAGEISFTVLSISISLIAVFTPLMFMGGVVGRLMREFALTLSTAVILSMMLSLTFTPMLCGKFLKAPEPPSNWFTKTLETGFTNLENGYRRALETVLNHMLLTLVVFAATLALAVGLYATAHTGFFPQQDTGFISGVMLTSQDASFAKTAQKIQAVADIIRKDPDVVETHLNIGGGGGNQANLNITLSPKDEGRKATARPDHRPAEAQAGPGRGGADLHAGQPGHQRRRSRRPGPVPVHPVRRRPDRAEHLGAQAAGRPAGRTRAQGRQLRPAVPGDGGQPDHRPRRRRPLRHHPGRHRQRDLQPGRPAPGRAVFHPAQRLPRGGRGPAEPAGDPGPVQRGLCAVAADRQDRAPVAVRQGRPERDQFPVDQSPGAVPLRHPVVQPGPRRVAGPGDPGGRERPGRARRARHPDRLVPGHGPGVPAVPVQRADPDHRGAAGRLCDPGRALRELHPPPDHPFTLPSAGVGALLALMAVGQDLNVIGIIAIILLIGIVKKNGIMIVDVALRLERENNLEAREAVAEACHQRLRPILMTTAAALFSAIPMILGNGTGSEFRQPLGWAIAGGLTVSQVLTLFTTPVIYIYLDRMRRHSGPKEVPGQPKPEAHGGHGPQVARPAAAPH